MEKKAAGREDVGIITLLGKLSGKFGFRIILIGFFIVFCIICIILRLFYIQVVKGEEYKSQGEEQYKSKYTIPAKRGRIITNDGEILAYDGEDFAIVLNPQMIENENIDKLMDFFKKHIPSLNTEKLKSEIAKRKKSESKFLQIDYTLGYNDKKVMEAELEEDRTISTGVFFKALFSRNYIKNNVFQEIVGFVNRDKKGVYGIEKYYDDMLTGTDGVVEGFKNPGRILTVNDVKKRKTISVQNGNNVILTIDTVLQYTLDEELKKAFEEYSAVSTMGILMEVETGKILAMSSYPKAENNAELKNRTIIDIFEPGSIFKPVTVAMGLQSNTITPNSTIKSSRTIKVKDVVIGNHDEKTSKGNVTLEDLIAFSGNVGIVKIAQTLEKDEFYNYLTSVGLGSRTGIDVYAEMTQKLIPKKDLSEVRKANISFGQGIAMTQIQMMMALNAVINNGKLMKPYIVDRLENDAGEEVLRNEPSVIRKVFDDDVSRYSRRYMEAVVKKGTGVGAQIKGYRIGGKTGTAQKSGSRGYADGKYFSSFFAFFPVDNPKYAILITVNEPRGNRYYGATVALPSARNVLEKLIRYKGINPQGNIEEIRKEKVIEEGRKKDLKKLLNEFNKNIMPDLTGLSLREIISIYPQIKFPKYKITGTGSVIEQYPASGTRLNKESEIRVILK